jgi:putative (di)nucleoside polyphosphate hydrolase
MKNIINLPLRLGVGIALLNKENKIFVGKRIDNPKDFWQMPQGGIDKNEKYLQAAKRELLEETGIKTIRVIKELNYWLEYDLPKNLLGKIWNGKYRGQKQKWFIMQFLGDDKEININTENAEFLEWKWIEKSDLPKLAVDFKVKIYNKIFAELTNLDKN